MQQRAKADTERSHTHSAERVWNCNCDKDCRGGVRGAVSYIRSDVTRLRALRIFPRVAGYNLMKGILLTKQGRKLGPSEPRDYLDCDVQRPRGRMGYWIL